MEKKEETKEGLVEAANNKDKETPTKTERLFPATTPESKSNKPTKKTPATPLKPEPKEKEGKSNKEVKKTPPAPKPKEGNGKAKKSKAGDNKNDWGHRIGSQSALIDEAVKKALAKGKALEVATLAKETNLSKARVSSHLKHLKEEKKVIKEYA